MNDFNEVLDNNVTKELEIYKNSNNSKNKKYKSRKLLYSIAAGSIVLGTLAFTGTTVTHAFSPITDSKNMKYVGEEPGNMPSNILNGVTDTKTTTNNNDKHANTSTDHITTPDHIDKYLNTNGIKKDDPDYQNKYNKAKDNLDKDGIKVVPRDSISQDGQKKLDHVNNNNELNIVKKEVTKQVPVNKSVVKHESHNQLVDTYTKTIHDGKGHSTTSTTTHYKKQGDNSVRKEDIHSTDIHTSNNYVVDDNSHQYTGKHKNVYQYNRYYRIHKNHLEIIKEREHQHELDVRKYEAAKKLHEINLQKLNQVKIEHENNLKKIQEQEQFHQENLSKIEAQEQFHQDNLNKIKAQEMQHELNVQKWNVAHGVEASQNG